MILLGFTSLVCGTGSFLYKIIHLRRRLQLSVLTIICQFSLTLIHLALWTGAMALFLGYVEEGGDDDNEELFENWKGDNSSSGKKARKLNLYKRV